jgi:hypothetical protein
MAVSHPIKRKPERPGVHVGMSRSANLSGLSDAEKEALFEAFLAWRQQVPQHYARSEPPPP